MPLAMYHNPNPVGHCAIPRTPSEGLMITEETAVMNRLAEMQRVAVRDTASRAAWAAHRWKQPEESTPKGQGLRSRLRLR